MNLVHELCDITADLEADSPLIRRYLIPAAVHFHRRLSLKAGDFEDDECRAMGTFIKCLSNLAGEEIVLETFEEEGLIE